MGQYAPVWDHTAAVEVTKDGNGIDQVVLRSPQGASIRLSLQGGQVTSWQNRRGEELLFNSSKATVKSTKATRGGISVCFAQKFVINRFDDEQVDHRSFSEDLDHTDDDPILLKQKYPDVNDHFDGQELFKQEHPCSFGPLLDSLEFGGGDEDDGGDDLDDELVPIGFSNKLGRQRTSKLRTRQKGFLNNRPGCVTGKHGFGVQHSYV